MFGRTTTKRDFLQNNSYYTLKAIEYWELSRSSWEELGVSNSADWSYKDYFRGFTFQGPLEITSWRTEESLQDYPWSLRLIRIRHYRHWFSTNQVIVVRYLSKITSKAKGFWES